MKFLQPALSILWERYAGRQIEPFLKDSVQIVSFTAKQYNYLSEIVVEKRRLSLEKTKTGMFGRCVMHFVVEDFNIASLERMNPS